MTTTRYVLASIASAVFLTLNSEAQSEYEKNKDSLAELSWSRTSYLKILSERKSEEAYKINLNERMERNFANQFTPLKELRYLRNERQGMPLAHDLDDDAVNILFRSSWETIRQGIVDNSRRYLPRFVEASIAGAHEKYDPPNAEDIARGDKPESRKNYNTNIGFRLFRTHPYAFFNYSHDKFGGFLARVSYDSANLTFIAPLPVDNAKLVLGVRTRFDESLGALSFIGLTTHLFRGQAYIGATFDGEARINAVYQKSF